MPRTLVAKTLKLLHNLPPWYSEDETARAVMNVKGKELQRVEDFLAEIRRQMNPQLADDTYGILGMWEARFGLPVKPAGVLVADRRAKVLAHIRTKQSAAGSDWEDSVGEALATTIWSYSEGPGSYQVTISFPYVVGGYSAGQALTLIRDFTPAHLQIIPAYSQGWLVGISLVGIEPL